MVTNKIIDFLKYIVYLCSVNLFKINIDFMNCAVNGTTWIDSHLPLSTKIGGGFLCGVVTILSTIGKTIQALKTDERYSLLRISQREQAMSHLRQPGKRQAIKPVNTLSTLIGLSRVIGYGLN